MEKKGFSVAEALMTLLIVSCLLAICAPLFSQRMKQDAMLMAGNVPSGTIIYYDGTICPDGYSALSEKYPNSKNAFLRNLDGTTKKPGDKENSAAPNITGQFGLKYSYGIEGAFVKDGTADAEQAGGKWYSGQGITFNANRSSSVYQDGVDEVRPYNLAFLICRKD